MHRGTIEGGISSISGKRPFEVNVSFFYSTQGTTKYFILNSSDFISFILCFADSPNNKPKPYRKAYRFRTICANFARFAVVWHGLRWA